MAENDNQATQPAAGNGADNTVAPRFALQRIYLKDVSFESPASPECFRQQYSPQVNFNLNTRSNKIDDNNYEIVLRMTADVKQNDKTIFLVEIQQAGIFEIGGLEGEQLEQVLTITCPNILYPYGREAIDSLVTKASFPPMMLAPVNFESVYLQAKQQQAQQAAAAGTETQ